MTIPQEFIDQALAGVPYNVGMYEVRWNRFNRKILHVIRRVPTTGEIVIFEELIVFEMHDADIGSWRIQTMHANWATDFFIAAKIPLRVVFAGNMPLNHAQITNPWGAHMCDLTNNTVAKLVAYTGAE